MTEYSEKDQEKISIIFESDTPERLDAFLANEIKKSRNQIQKMIEQNLVKINGRIPEKKSELLRKGDIIEVSVPRDIRYTLRKEQIPIEVIWEDDNFVVINKPAGMVVHPSPHHLHGTLVSAILEHVEYEDSDFSAEDLAKGKVRPGIVHRLDKEVSGVLLVAKNKTALEMASEMFRARRVKKTYIALCFGKTEKRFWEIRKNIKRSDRKDKVMTTARAGEGKEAITLVKVIDTNPEIGLTLFELNPITGRTHQIRVHLSSDGFPIVGDVMYGGGGEKLEELWKKIGQINYRGIFLHSYSLEIFDKKFCAQLPPEFKEAIYKIFGEKTMEKIREIKKN